MNAYRSRPNVVPWPPILVIGAVLASLALHAGLAWPLAFAGARPLGWLLIAAAFAIDIWAMATLRRAHTTIMPHRGSRHLVTSGPFRLSRNPIYLANVTILVGLGLASGIGWFLVLAIVDAAATQLLAIRREESHLLAQFGYEYERYCRSVRRWI
ncbi:isoprenylcysteine carboxylmethyltransferase family protein [Pseudohoeflea sp. DP4N28-3]|uniref:Isoprenylcysteine carboxylmethyltransferase family protein n=2 Tax=Pseudohoeflea coraliihabitans TaxID=2860393 RepID=A0ABS6WTX4_9HYPH|nr:isoprenylcysteine carboxylmethyltransferase family protein [Pseudohoeflea sp. DP4N28-3]